MAVVAGVWQMAAGRASVSTQISPSQSLPEAEQKTGHGGEMSSGGTGATPELITALATAPTMKADVGKHHSL